MGQLLLSYNGAQCRKLPLIIFLVFFSVAINALKSFLTHTESEVMIKFLDQNNAWTLLEAEDTSPHGCLHLARSLQYMYCTCNCII